MLCYSVCVAPTALQILQKDHGIINEGLKFIFNKVPGHFKALLTF